MSYTGEQLLELLDGEDGLTHRVLAERLELNLNSVNGKVFRARRARAFDNEGRREILEDNEEGNNREISSKSIFITSLDELIQFFDVDLEEWRIDKHVVNYWGSGSSPHTQVKAWMSKIFPEAIHPVISPVQISMGNVPDIQTVTRNYFRAFIFPDPHFGFERDLVSNKLMNYHDRRALDVALQIAQETQPETIVILGDILDLAEWSDKFIRSPEAHLTTQSALVEAAWWLAQLRAACPHAKIVALEGNHEARITKKLMVHFPMMYGLKPVDFLDGPALLSVENLLGMRSLDIKWIDGYPKNEYWLADNIRCIHGEVTRGVAGQTTRSVVKDRQYTDIFGHIHRIELATQTLRTRGKNHNVTAFSPGCLCHIDGRVPSGRSQMNWQNGIGIVDYLSDGTHTVVAIPINEGVALFEGNIFEARNRIEDIKHDTDLQI